MKRPWHAWSIFSAALLIVFSGLGWASWTVVEFERSEREVQARTEIEEAVRLALWRMDSTLATVLAQENVRPPEQFDAFYEAEDAYQGNYQKFPQGQVLVPSELLTFESPFIHLHFQISPDGELKSPQVPEGSMRELACGSYTSEDAIDGFADRLNMLGNQFDQSWIATIKGGEGDLSINWMADQQQRAQTDDRQSSQSVQTVNQPPAQQILEQGNEQEMQQGQQDAYTNNKQAQQKWQQELGRNGAEWNSRYGNTLRQMQLQSTGKGGKGSKIPVPQSFNAINDNRNNFIQELDRPELENLMQPIWIDNALLLVRTIRRGKSEWIQGAWLNWEYVQELLQDDVQDLLPEASLIPVERSAGINENRLLASIPAALDPGNLPLPRLDGMSSIQVWLVLTWICVLIAAGAVMTLLKGAIGLSERRGAFVSSVTHEMRTPLTTFQMYTEMLSEGMVSEEKQQEYLAALQDEASRLGHLVENVLAYSRLEKGSPAERAQKLRVHDLLDRLTPRLSRHAARCDRNLTLPNPDALPDVFVQADPSAVDQILFNLIDNACKYGAGDILLTVSSRGTTVAIDLADHGQGVADSDRKKIFLPFSKSARDAAGTAPGVGLGLALSRELARAMGGELALDTTWTDGARFTLTLPTVA
jgi:signal transduction histidine kinase